MSLLRRASGGDSAAAGTPGAGRVSGSARMFLLVLLALVPLWGILGCTGIGDAGYEAYRVDVGSTAHLQLGEVWDLVKAGGSLESEVALLESFRLDFLPSGQVEEVVFTVYTGEGRRVDVGYGRKNRESATPMNMTVSVTVSSDTVSASDPLAPPMIDAVSAFEAVDTIGLEALAERAGSLSSGGYYELTLPSLDHQSAPHTIQFPPQTWVGDGSDFVRSEVAIYRPSIDAGWVYLAITAGEPVSSATRGDDEPTVTTVASTASRSAFILVPVSAQ